jgi:GNAT superfamily N-acetyltransferase
MKGGESGALVRPLTPTSASEGSESESWTQTVNPFADKGAVKPTQQAGAAQAPKAKLLKVIPSSEKKSPELLKARVDTYGDMYKRAMDRAYTLKQSVEGVDNELKNSKAYVDSNPNDQNAINSYNALISKRNEMAEMARMEISRADAWQKGIEKTQLEIDESLTASESISNSISNMATQIKGFLPASGLAISTLQNKIQQGAMYVAGKLMGADDETASRVSTELSQNLPSAGILGTTQKEARQFYTERLGELEKEQKPTKSIIKTFEEGDIAGLGAAILDGGSSVISSVITSAPTGGVGIFTEMMGRSVYDSNNEKAKRLKISVDELYDRGLDEAAVPLAIGAVSASLEKIGLDGISKAINKKIGSKALKDVFEIILEGSKEAGTEWLQTGAEEYNKAIARGMNAEQAGEAALSKMLSEEGREAALKGAAGSGVSIATGRAAKSLYSIAKSNRDKLYQDLAKVETLARERANPNLSSEALASIDREINNTTANMQKEVLDQLNRRANLTEENASLVEGIEANVKTISDDIESKKLLSEDPSLSDDAKIIIDLEIADLEAKRLDLAAQSEEIIKNNRPVTLTKNTSPTNEKYGTINRNDGKGVVDLTKEEYLREEGKLAGVEEGVSEPLKDAESVAKSLEVALRKGGKEDEDGFKYYNEQKTFPIIDAFTDKMNEDYQRDVFENEIKTPEQFISEAYLKAKADGSNPKLVKAVEEQLNEQEDVEVVPTPAEEVKGVVDAAPFKEIKSKERVLDDLERKYGKRFSNEETYHLIQGTDGKFYIKHEDRGKEIKVYNFQNEEQAIEFAKKQGIELLTIAEKGVGFTSENKAKYDAELANLEITNEQEDVDIQQQVDEEKADDRAVGDIAKEDNAYQESRQITEEVSRENPDASILITPKGNDLNLTALYVGKENRGKGIGSKVLESVKKQADKVGKKVVLDATNELDEETDLERLGKFYEANGFTKVGDNKFEYNPNKGDIAKNGEAVSKEETPVLRDVKEPKAYAEAADAYKSTELGSSENAKNKKQALVEQAETKEGKEFVESQVAQLKKNEDGTITVFRSGTLQDGHNPATTSRKMAETIASERKKQGLSSDIIEVKVNPSDISVVVKGIESEVFVKVDETNKERLDKNTVQKQKTKSELLTEKGEVQKELEKTKKALADSEKAFNEGTYPFSENVFNDANKKQKAKIKNLEWQLSKINESLLSKEQTPETQNDFQYVIDKANKAGGGVKGSGTKKINLSDRETAILNKTIEKLEAKAVANNGASFDPNETINIQYEKINGKEQKINTYNVDGYSIKYRRRRNSFIEITTPQGDLLIVSKQYGKTEIAYLGKSETLPPKEQTPKQKEDEQEKPTKEDGKPLPKGVQGLRTEGQAGKESAELRTEEEEVTPQAGSVGVEVARKAMSKEIDSQVSAKENELIEKQKRDIEKAKKDLEAINSGDKSVIDEYVKKSGYKLVTKEVIANNPKSELLKKSEGKYYLSTGASIQVKTAEQIAIDGASKKANSKPTGNKAGNNQYVDAYNAITKFSEGKITAEEAKSIIEKAGLKIPKAVEQSLKETPQAEEKVSGGLPQEEKTNLENISKDAGVNFQEVRNVYNKYGDGKPLNEITLEDYQKAEEKRQGGKEKEAVEEKEEASPKEKLFSKVRAYNNLSKRERSDMFGNKLRSDIMSDAAAIKYTIRPTKSGNYILIDDRGKQVRAIGIPRSKDVIQEEKRTKERRSRAKRELPLSIKHSVAQDIANGVKFNRKELKDVTGWDDADIPFWLTVNEGGVSLEFYNVRFQEKGGFLVEDDMNFVSDVADAIRDFAFNKGRTAALEFIEKQQEIIENGGFTDAELQEQMEYYQAKLDEENFDYFAEYLSNLSDEEAQLLSDELREAEKENDKLLINEILNENEDQRKTEQGEQDANIEALDIEREGKEREAKIAEIEENIKNLQNSVAKKQRQADKLSKEAQGDVFRGTKAQMFDAGEELRQLTKDIREQNAEIERQKEKLAELKEKQIQPSNQLKIQENAKKQQSGQMREQGVQDQPQRKGDSDMPIINEAELQDGETVEEEVEEEGLPKLTKEQQIEAERRSLNEPKNVSDLAKIFNKILGLSPKESVMAARLFDVKAKNMSELLGITKDEYYQRYWFTGELSEKGNQLNQIVGENAQLAQDIRDNLQVARDMEAKGKDAKTIRLATGWEKGADGKWRYEIPDVELRGIVNLYDELTKERNDIIYNKAKGKTIAELKKENSPIVKKLVELENKFNELNSNKEIPLGEIVSGEVLKAYPKLKDIKVIFGVDMGDGTRGSWIKNENTIYILESLNTLSYNSDSYSTLIHEIQHAIQDIEGFAKGGNELTIAAEVQLIKDKIENAQKLRDVWQNTKAGTEQEKIASDEYNKAMDEVNWKKYNELSKYLPKNLQRDMLSSFEGYQAIAGEVEARNVQTRMGMTPEQRRATTLQETEDVARDEQIVLFGEQEGGQPLFQDRRGAWSKIAASAKRIISMYDKARLDTAVHEILGHDFLDEIISLSATNKEFEQDLNTIIDEYIKSSGNKTSKATLLNELKNFNVESNNQSVNARAIHEWFSRTAEGYFMGETNIKPDSKLAKMFEQFRQYLTDLFNTMTSRNYIIPSEPMKQIFRKAFGAENFDFVNDYAEANIMEGKLDVLRITENEIPQSRLDKFKKLREERKGLGQEEDVDIDELVDAARYLSTDPTVNVFNVVDELVSMYPQKEEYIRKHSKTFEKVFVAEGKKVRETARSVYESEVVSPEMKQRAATIEDLFSYTPEKLQEKMEDVESLIADYSIDDLMAFFATSNEIPFKEYPLFLAAMQKRISRAINELNNSNQGQSAAKQKLLNYEMTIMDRYIAEGTATGQRLNYFKVLKNMSTDGKLRFFKRKFKEESGNAVKEFQDLISNLRKERDKAYKDNDYFLEENLSLEQRIEDLEAELAKERSTKAKNDKRKDRESLSQAKPPKRKISQSELNDILKELGSAGLGQSLEDLNAALKLGFYIIQDKPKTIEQFTKDWNKITKQNKTQEELSQVYRDVRKYATENEGVDIDYFDSDAMIQSSIDSFNERASQKKNLAKKELDSDIAKAEKEAMKTQMSEKDKEVKAKEALKKREKEIRDNFLDSLSQDGLWQQYVKSVSGRILGNLGSKLGAKQSEKALLDEFTQLATNELNKAIDELMPKQKGGKVATPNYAQQLGDLIANQEKLADIFDKAVKDFAEKNKGNANAQSVLSKLNGLKNPFSEKLMENALEKEAQNYAIKIGDLAFKYAGLRQNLKDQIVAQIVAETGLTGQQATQLEQDLRAKFDNIIAETEQDTAGQLAKAILSNAKKELGLGKKQQDYVKELLGYLKNKAKDYYKTTNKQALVDPFEQLKYAVEMLNDANGRKIWDDSKAELIAKIDSDKDLSQQEKDDLKAYLDDYQNAIFDQLLSKNKLFNNVKKVLAEESPFVKKDGSVDWNGIIIQAKGNVEIAKQIILDSVADKLQGYSGSQVNSVIDAIGREYQRRIDEKRAEIIEKQLKDISDKKVIFKKKIATGFVQKLVEMENSGALGDQRFEQALKEWIGFSDMTPDKWSRLRELIVDAEEAPEGNERDRAIENLSAYIKFNKIGKFAEIYASAYYAGLLARPTTIIKNSTGIIEPLLTLFYKFFTDRNYAKAMLQGLKRGDAADIWGGGLVQGGKLDEEVGNDGLPRVNMLKQWRMQQKGIIPKLFALGAKPLDLLSMADALSQAMVERGAEYEFYARYLLEKNKEDIRNGVQGVVPITEKEARRIAIKRLSDDAMLDWAFAQAEDEFASRKIVPSSARLNRRAYEIVSESLLPTSVRELAQNLALEESYKSKLISFRGMTSQTRAQKRLETNYGVATFIGSFAKGLVDLLAEGVGYVAGGATKVLPVTEARRNQIRNSVERSISMRVLPFARGISNVVEKSLEKTPYGIVSGVIGATAEKLSYGKPKTIDEILQHQYMMNRNKAKIAKSATSMIIGSAIYYTLLSASKEWDDEEEKEERYYLPTGFYSAGETVRFGKNKIERYTLPVNCVVLYGRIIPLSLFGTVGIGSMITAQAYDNFLSKEKKKQGAVVDPDNPESIKGFSSFVSSSGNAILNMSAMQSISELQESVSSKGTMDFGDYASKLSVKSIALPIPFSGTANQIIQGARYLSGDKTAQAAIGADEKIYKELGLAGIVYNRPVLDWRGRPVNAVLQNQEGIASFVSMLDKRPLDKIDMYLLKELEFNPVIDKRLSENFADLNMVGMSKDEYYDYTKNVGRTVNNYIEAYFDTIKNYQIPQDKIDELAAEGKNETDLKKQLKTIKKTFVSDFLNIAEQEHMLNYQFSKGIINGASYEAKFKANNDRLENLIEKINDKGE